MPILSQKDNPPTTNLDCPIIETEGTWWIAKVMSRQEKAFAFDLLKQNIKYYLPYYKKITKKSDGKNRKTFMLLFPSYVPFISADPYPLLTKTNRIATILPVQAQFRFKQQLQQVFIANESEIIIHPVEPCEYKTGEMVKVVTGVLKGMVGKIVQYQGDSKLILEIESIGGVSISINDFQVELVQTNTKVADA